MKGMQGISMHKQGGLWQWVRPVAAVVVLLLLSGCPEPSGPDTPETAMAEYERGQKLLKAGRQPEALLAFQNVIDARRGKAPQSHLEAGRLALETLSDPLLALYHFKRSIATETDPQRRALIEPLVTSAQKAYAQTLPGAPFAPQVERLDLLEMLAQTREQSLTLKQQLAEAKAKAARLQLQLEQHQANLPMQKPEPQQLAAPQTAVTPSQQPRPAVVDALQTATTYTVQPGDTLSVISRKVYGNSSQWRQIFEANRALLRSPHDLKVGQTLNIPR
jgi:nucleoid-associated protein YgaU